MRTTERAARRDRRRPRPDHRGPAPPGHWPSSHGLQRRQPRGGQAARPEAVKLVPKNDGRALQDLPLTFEDDVADRRHGRPEQPAGPRRPAQLARHPPGQSLSSAPLKQDRGGCSPRPTRRARKSRSSTSSPSMATDVDLGNGTAARPPSTSTTVEEMANAAPVRKLINMVLLLAHQGQGLGHPLRAVRGRVQDALPLRRRAVRDGAAAAPPRHRHQPAASRSWPTSTSPSGACRRTAASS